MDDVRKFIKNARELDARKLIVESAGMNTKELADINRQNLRKGELSSGDETQEYATIYYTNKKAQMGSISVPNMDFYYEGDFHEGIYSKKIGNEIEFGSKDSKAKFIQQNWGDDVFGVQQRQLIEITDSDIVNIIDKKLMKI